MYFPRVYIILSVLCTRLNFYTNLREVQQKIARFTSLYVPSLTHVNYVLLVRRYVITPAGRFDVTGNFVCV